MARVLFAWELGGDLGHARRVLEVARGLRVLGHETAFAFQDLLSLCALGASAEWFQAPLLAPPADPPTHVPLSHSEILVFRGFGDALSVAGAMRGWLGLFSLWKADALVADYAPGALVAARVARLPHVAIGSGFSTPPPRDPMPALRSWAAIEETALRRADAALLAGVRGGVERVNASAPLPASASDVFRVPNNVLCTWPEIDPFGERTDAEYVGPQDDPSVGAQAQWRGSARPRVFAYLKAHDPRLPLMLDAISKLPGESIVVALGLAPAQAAACTTAKTQVLAQPVALAPLLAECDLCICHGGPGTIAHSLRAGVPLALVPEHLEQVLVARQVASAGAAVIWAPEAAATGLARWLAEAAANESIRKAAAASALRGRMPRDAAARVAAMLGA